MTTKSSSMIVFHFTCFELILHSSSSTLFSSVKQPSYANQNLYSIYNKNFWIPHSESGELISKHIDVTFKRIVDQENPQCFRFWYQNSIDTLFKTIPTNMQAFSKDDEPNINKYIFLSYNKRYALKEHRREGKTMGERRYYSQTSFHNNK